MLKIRRLKINTRDFTKLTIFSDKPYAKNYSYEFLAAAKEDNLLLVEHYIKQHRYLIYDFDDVSFCELSNLTITQ